MKDRIVIDFSALDRIASKLDAAGDQLSSAMTSLSGAHPTGESGGDLRIDGSLALRSVPGRISAANVYQAVQGYRDALSRVSGYSRTLAARVRSVSGTFDTAEGTLAGEARGRSAGSAAPTADGTAGQGSGFDWSGLWDAISEFGIIGGAISAFGELATGGTTAAPKRAMEFMKSTFEVTGKIASGISEKTSSAGFDWRKLIGFDQDDVPKGWSEAIGKELSKYSFKNATKVSEKISVGCKWAGTVLTVGTTAWDNWHEEGNSTARKIGETIVESGVKIGSKIFIGAGATLAAAALGFSAPAVGVGLVTLGVTAALDKACEYFNNGHDLAETFSDLVFDWIPGGIEKAGEVLNDAVGHVTEYVNNARRKVGNAVSSAGRAISGWWDSLTGHRVAASAW